jgi:hypothetical protein
MKPLTKAPLQLPIKDKAKLSHLIHYLVHTRSIPHSLTKSLIDSGKLYADPKGNAVFLLLGKEKMVVGAELRGTNLTRWHGMAKGSRKDLGFFGVQNHHPHKAVLCESATRRYLLFIPLSNLPGYLNLRSTSKSCLAHLIDRLRI